MFISKTTHIPYKPLMCTNSTGHLFALGSEFIFRVGVNHLKDCQGSRQKSLAFNTNLVTHAQICFVDRIRS